jgi:hypothetical protein
MNVCRRTGAWRCCRPINAFIMGSQLYLWDICVLARRQNGATLVPSSFRILNDWMFWMEFYARQRYSLLRDLIQLLQLEKCYVPIYEMSPNYPVCNGESPSSDVLFPNTTS